MPEDFRQAFRMFRSERGFTVAVILTLALGIGANTAIFSVVNGILIRPLPFKDPGRLYAISEIIPSMAARFPQVPVNFSHFFEWRNRASTIEQIAVMRPALLNLTGAGEPMLLTAQRITAGLFEMLDVHPRLGRTFTRQEEIAGNDSVVIMTDSLWRTRFSANPDIVGKSLVLDGRPYAVVGVLPPSFVLPNQVTLGNWVANGSQIQIFTPIGYTREDLQENVGDFNYAGIARLRAGAAPEKALSELNVIEADVMRGTDEKLDVKAVLKPLDEQVVGSSKHGLIMIMCAVGAALLVLCLNLANLWFARAAAHTRDFAIRSALGASQSALIRHSLVESFTLAGFGGATGVVLAFLGLGTLLKSAPIDLPRLNEVHIDATALIFAIAISVAAGVICGALPAFRTALQNPQESLKSGSRTITEGVRGTRIRQTLVAIEVALTAALLITAGLLINSFVRLMDVEKGFDIERVLAVNVSLPNAKYSTSEQRSMFFDRLLAKAATLPGVTGSSIVSALPLSGETWIDMVGTEHDSRPLFERPSVNVRFIGPEYFKILGVPLKAGRLFGQADRKRPVAILSKATAERLWPGQDAVGRIMMQNNRPVRIVGVVPDIRSTSLDKDPVLMLYIPYWQRPRAAASLLLRTGMDPRATAGVVRSTIWNIDPEVPVPDVKTLAEVMNTSVAQRRFQTILIIAFAGSSLALACLGIYAVLSYSMARRRSEIGIRMALGAGAVTVRRMAVVQGMQPAMAGLIAGVGLSLAIGQMLSSLLFRVSARDPLTIALVAFVLLAVAAAACFIPALRASRIDPASVLRAE